MRVMTILGTRPEIIRLSLVIPKLDEMCDHLLIHTSQNYHPLLGDVFFEKLRLRRPNRYLAIQESDWVSRLGFILAQVAEMIKEHCPDRVLILGDTDSGLAAIVAKRLGIPVYHAEAGNRCYDDRVPEEINRRVIDHASDVLMPYTERSRANLVREGIEARRTFVVGNPIKEVLDHYQPQIQASTMTTEMGLRPRNYILATAHRAENVDDPNRLKSIVQALDLVSIKYMCNVVCSIHPRTKARLWETKTEIIGPTKFIDPLGFFDFAALESQARCVITDSGTVQEECCILGTPTVTIRDTTERPETVECGSNVLAGVEPDDVLRCVRQMVSGRGWAVPEEYRRTNVSDVLASLVTSPQ